jgi:hypothetical protein
MKTKKIPGLNIQYPWSRLLLSGEKSIETRSYPIPGKFIGVEIAVIETPGRSGKKNGVAKAQIVGTITFVGSKRYESKQSWLKDHKKHLVDEKDPQYGFDPNRPKHGWVVGKVRTLRRPVAPPLKRGIVFARDCVIPAT